MIFFEGENMTAGYGGADIIKNCNIHVKAGEIVVVIGPNGAGKSTAMKAMLGMLKLKNGSVKFNNEEITTMLPQDRVSLGIAFVPQTKNVFTGMTVEENLEMGAFLRKDDIQDTINQIYDLFPDIKRKKKSKCR